MRLKGRTSVQFVFPQLGHFILPPRKADPFGITVTRMPSAPAVACCAHSSSNLSARKRLLHSLQSTNGSLNVSSCPEYFQTKLFRMIEESSPSISSRSYTIHRH